MNAARPAEILRRLEADGAPDSDADLLARFAASKDAAAFAELVRRHGALVLGVCRRVTGHPQDAEDAFQATFLVLAKKAGSLTNAALLGNWLYGVAFRVAQRAKRSAARRRAREVAVAVLPDPPAPLPSPAMPELAPILDEELAALPACYREAIVLCDLRGASREEAAAALGIPEGTLSSRLANGRRKLAARLTKRGVALSVAALPLALSEAQAAVAVPNDLITRTSGLVTDWAAGGAVPGPLARLAEGGLAVRRTLLIGAVMVVGIVGAVFAARPDDAPPVDPPKPVVAQKPDPAAPPNEEPKPANKPAVVYTSTPRLKAGWDVKLTDIGRVVWSPDGTAFAIVGNKPVAAGLPKTPGFMVMNDPMKWNPSRDPVAVPLWKHGNFVGFSPDGENWIADRREYDLLSGYHQLQYRGEEPGRRTVDFEGADLHGYGFPPDGKTFRAMRYEYGDKGRYIKMEVVEVDAVSGKRGKSLLKLDYSRGSVLSPDGKRLAVRDENLTKVTVYDVDRGEKLSEHTFPAEKLVSRAQFSSLVFSADGRRLVVARGVEQTFVLNTDTGAALPALDGLTTALTDPHEHAFTGDNRLLALACSKYKEPKALIGGPLTPEDLIPAAKYLTVWDTQTGKVLKMWPGAPRVAFHPTRPVLAILEPNGTDTTRVGFWDFAAEVGKK